MSCISFIEATLDDKKWDDIRTQRADALDAILESLGIQLVPPDFHQASSDSSLFGSQHSDDEPEPEVQDRRGSPQLQYSPTLTVRDGHPLHKEKEVKDRKKWKTLRDFVDERAIEDVLDTIENDRNALDVSVPLYFYGKELDVVRL
jgi:autophagy-related protein 17